MATIITKNSSTASSVPLNTQLVQGELAVNVTDKRLYTQDATDTVVELGTNPSSLTLPNGTANGVPYLNGSKVLTSGSALTFDGTNLDVQSTNSAIRAYSTGTNGAFFKSQNSGGTSYLGIEGASAVFGATYGLSLWNTGSGATVFGVANAEQMRLTSTGLGIGTSSPAYKLDVSTTTGDTQAAVYDRASGSSAARLDIRTSGTGASQWFIQTGNTASGLNGSLRFYDQAAVAERMRLDASGNLGLGVTPSAWAGIGGVGVLEGYSWGVATLGAADISAFVNNAYFNGTNWIYRRGASAARYELSAGGVHKWFQAPSGTAGAAISFTQAMTLDASGRLQIGTTTAAGMLTVVAPASTPYGSFDAPTSGWAYTVYKYNGTTYGYLGQGSGIVTGGSATDLALTSVNNLVFATGGANERARIDSSGNLLVGTTSTVSNAKFYSRSASNPAGAFAVTGTTVQATAALAISKPDATNTTSQIFAQFYVGDYATGSGQINANGASQAAFGSFSDARLKENIADLPSQLPNIMALRPVEFDYIESEGGGHQTGFIAQEIEVIYPDSVGERADGMKTVTGWNKTEARLVKAIQEQQALIESLTSRITALEAA